jgi:DNA uptake protein ComE-like DNA-binding protein
VGRFASVDDLLKVSGIGEKTLERIRPLVTVD